MNNILNFDFKSVFPTEIIKSIANKSGYNESTLEQWMLEIYQNKININIVKEKCKDKKIIKNIPDEFKESVQVKIPFSMCKKEFMTEIFKSCGFERTNSIDEDLINKYIMFCKMNNISSDYTEFIVNIPLWDTSNNTFKESENFIERNEPFNNVDFIVIDAYNNYDYSLNDIDNDLYKELNIIRLFNHPEVKCNDTSNEDEEISNIIIKHKDFSGGFLMKADYEIEGIHTLTNIYNTFCDYTNYCPYSNNFDFTFHKLVYNRKKYNICSIIFAL